MQTTATCASPGTSAKTTSYFRDPVTGAYSEQYVSGHTTTWRDYIVAAGAIVAERFNTAGTVSVDYFSTDHLGSTAVITDGSHNVVERDSFDAWGRPRNPDGSVHAACFITGAVTRGFTGQETMRPVCGIDFNARLYDPTVSRFLSGDSMVGNPFSGQNLNRFSYAENMPTARIDPTGHDGCVGDGGGQCGHIQSWGGIEGYPCWECSGPGLTTDPITGLPVPASNYAASGEYRIEAQGDPDPNDQKTVYSLGALADSLAQMTATNATGGIGTNLVFDLSGAVGGVDAQTGGTGGAGSGPQIGDAVATPVVDGEPAAVNGIPTVTGVVTPIYAANGSNAAGFQTVFDLAGNFLDYQTLLTAGLIAKFGNGAQVVPEIENVGRALGPIGYTFVAGSQISAAVHDIRSGAPARQAIFGGTVNAVALVGTGALAEIGTDALIGSAWGPWGAVAGIGVGIVATGILVDKI